MAINKKATGFGFPWETNYGYAQAVKVGETIYVAGQIAHDENGKKVGEGNMEAQMRQAYANIKKVLAWYGATMNNIVEEVLFVTDMDAAFDARVKLKEEVFSGSPVVASTIVQIQRLGSLGYMIEIRCTARV